MLSFKQFLDERVLNIGLSGEDHDLRQQHSDSIVHMLKTSYASLDGGYGGMGNGTQAEHDAIHADVHNPEHFIKGTVRDGKLVSVSIYKKTAAGRKRIASGTDGSMSGKEAYKKTSEEDRDQVDRHAYAEVSHKPEAIAKKMGVPQVPNDKVGNLLGKDIVKHDDGYHYDRKLGNEVKTKVMVGHPKLSKDHKFY